MKVTRAEIVARTEQLRPHLSPGQQRRSREFLNQLDLYAGADLVEITGQVQRRGDLIQKRLDRSRNKIRAGLLVCVAAVVGTQVMGQAIAPALVSTVAFFGGLGFAGFNLQERNRWMGQAQQVDEMLVNLSDCAEDFEARKKGRYV